MASTSVPRAALWLPIFDDLADPIVLARLAAEAEAAGWDGVFVWDHIRWRAPVAAVADPWVCLAAMATATERIRIGPMVCPLARRRPAKVARETATLDRLCGGRLTLGVGLGGDQFGAELSKTGEETDDRVRAEMLDESLTILRAAWTGEVVEHRGTHFLVDGIRFLPAATQAPTIPVWVAGMHGSVRPLRRAVAHDGFFPVNVPTPDDLAAIAATLRTLRPGGTLDGFALVAELRPGADPRPYADAGATWLLTEFDPEGTELDHVRGVVRDGPPR